MARFVMPQQSGTPLCPKLYGHLDFRMPTKRISRCGVPSFECSDHDVTHESGVRKWTFRSPGCHAGIQPPAWKSSGPRNRHHHIDVTKVTHRIFCSGTSTTIQIYTSTCKAQAMGAQTAAGSSPAVANVSVSNVPLPAHSFCSRSLRTRNWLGSMNKI